MPQQRFAPQPTFAQIYAQHQAQIQQQQAESALQQVIQQMRGEQGMSEQRLRGEQQQGITATEQAGATQRSNAQIAGQQKIAELGELGRLLASPEITTVDKTHPENTQMYGVPLHKLSEGDKVENEYVKLQKSLEFFDNAVAHSPEIQALGPEVVAKARMTHIAPLIASTFANRNQFEVLSHAYLRQAQLAAKKDPTPADIAEYKGATGFIEAIKHQQESRIHQNNPQLEIFNAVSAPMGKLMGRLSSIGTKKGPNYMKTPMSERLVNDFEEATQDMSPEEKGKALFGFHEFGSFFKEPSVDPFKAAMGQMLQGGGNAGGQGQAPSPSVAPQQAPPPAAPGAPAPKTGTLDPNANPFAGMPLTGVEFGGKQ